MSEKYTYYDSLKEHREATNKFDYFFLGAILTILGFSVQSFNPSDGNYYPWMTHLAWGFLLLSFLSGLYRQERLLLFLAYQTSKLYYKAKAEKFQLAKEGQAFVFRDVAGKMPWTKQEVNEEVKKFDETIDKVIKFEKDENNKASLGYFLQKTLFICGMVLIIAFKIINYYKWD